jgi:sRNA-binding carbon storage regulator CsrA
MAAMSGERGDLYNLLAYSYISTNRMEALPMGFLVLSRKEGEEIRLSIQPDVDTEKLLNHLLTDGITIRVSDLTSNQVRIGIEAPREVLVLRSELEDHD